MTVGRRLPTRSDGEPEGWLRTRRGRLVVATGVALLLSLALPVLVAGMRAAGTRSTDLSGALAAVRAHQVVSASLDTPAGDGTGTLLLRTNRGEELQSRFPAAYAGELTERLVGAGIRTESSAPPAGVAGLGSELASWLPALALLGLLLFLLRDRLSIGGAARRTSAPSRVTVPETRFTDVAGCPEAISDLAEISRFLKDPEPFLVTGARLPRGYLLSGPPGTGKTLLARAVAGEAGVAFFATSGADFNDQFVGIGRSRIRNLFARARKTAVHEGGAVIFVDEIDAVGGTRQSGRSDSAADDHDATLVALLTEMDGFDARGRIVVLAATNRPDSLDPALTRPGRFDRRISVPAPDPAGRSAILQVHAQRIHTTADVDLHGLGRRTPGLVGADLEGLVNEAALEAGRRGLPAADMSCFEEALATAAMGRARTGMVINERDRAITAWHEAGHTVLALVEPDADDPVQVTIVPRGPAGGVTWMSGNDHLFIAREQAIAQLAVALGGRAAEEVLLGSHTQGAAGDLDSATRLATAMATEYGMTRLGLARRPVSGPTLPDDVLDVVNELLADALAQARLQLEEHRPLLTAVAEALLERETLKLVDLRVIQNTVARIPVQRLNSSST